MKFKEMLCDDVSDVFLNTDEFAEFHTVNGKEDVRIVTDDYELLNREKYRKEVKDDGTSLNRGIIYVKASDIGRLPKTGHQMTIDGMHFRVEHAINETGIYAVTIRAVR